MASFDPKDKHSKHKPDKTRYQKTKQKSVDYGPNLQPNNSDSKKPAKKKVIHGSTKPKQLASDVGVNAVPNPAPENLVTQTYIFSTATFIHTAVGVLPASPTATAGFSPLPPLASFAVTSAVLATYTAQTSLSYPLTPQPTPTVLSPAAQASPSNSVKHMPVTEIIVIAISGAFVVFGIIATIWVCNRPRKRKHPVPSLPIFQEDTYIEEKQELDDESLFGGKERTSARPGSNGILWTWTQYPHVSMSNKSSAKSDNSVTTSTTARRMSSVLGGKTGYPFDGRGGTTAQHPQTQGSALQQQLQAALAKAANRVSTMSASIYPASPQSNAGYTDIGIAMTSGTTDLPIPSGLQRKDSKGGKRRSVTALAYSDDHAPSNSRAYGASLSVPKPTLGSQSSSSGGRMPVKGPYAPTSSMRSSTSLARVPSASRRSVANFEATQYPLPLQSPTIKSDARRERDTQALTSALGLTSPPPPPSPQTTIHPDDSITLAGDRRRSRSMGHSRQRSSFMSPTMEASARLGNLMLAELPSSSMASLPSSRAVPAANGGANNKSSRIPTRKRTDDKPPRVPSPPPLPSLAQMALAHHNPDDYVDYRSPTYSIYGLYEADRKSRNPGDGNY
ncbi:hypothetical protein BXZ70DRAFT_916005 [Cristinia sonorae]|uniref:Transmembrane protein n=1 Tax=Cristinia sonorae TaxID=1940300 RepID=A0A8K0UXJ8_9AGAR|nr:hypothetical protein BXZ70DRAFT_916005 [Cristinia sonorae]